MTSLDSIPSMPDGTIIPILQGKLHTIQEIKTLQSKPDAEGKTKPFQAQSFLLESPSGKVWCGTLNKACFIGPEMTGVQVKIVATAGEKGALRGIVKQSYPGKDQNGNPVTRTRVNLDHGAILSRVEVQPPAKPQPPPDPVLAICREWRYCWDKFRMVAPPEITPEISAERVTAIWIECNKRGVKIPITAPSPATPTKPEPPVPAAGKPVTETVAPTTQPKLTKDQLGTKIVGEMKITPSMLKDQNLEAVFDACYADAKNDIPVEFLDAAFDAAKKRHKEEGKLYTAILTHWMSFLDDARKFQQAKKDDAAVEEMDITPPFD